MALMIYIASVLLLILGLAVRIEGATGVLYSTYSYLKNRSDHDQTFGVLSLARQDVGIGTRQDFWGSDVTIRLLGF